MAARSLIDGDIKDEVAVREGAVTELLVVTAPVSAKPPEPADRETEAPDSESEPVVPLAATVTVL